MSSLGPDVLHSGPLRYARADRFGLPSPCEPRRPETAVGVICPQRPSRLEHVMGPPPFVRPQGEDCLFLSVAAPAVPGPHPVIVFLHGGAYVSGSGLEPWYDGARLATEQQVVVVSVSYRLGPFGWLVLDGVSPGNLGLHDQMCALEWVRDGIDRFGGDPGAVTLVGQSAGGRAAGLLLEVPAARALVRRGIVQSGAPFDTLAVSNADVAEEVGRRFARALGADPATASVDDMLAAAARVSVDGLGAPPEVARPPWGPVRGRDPVPARPTPPTAPHDLEILIGWNLDELTAFGVGDDLDSVLAPSQRVVADPWIGEATRLREAGVAVWGYRLDWRPAGSPFGATHCLELPLLPGGRATWAGCPMLGRATRGEVEHHGRALRAAWAHFARTGRIDLALTRDVPITWARGDLSALRTPHRTGLRCEP